MARADEQPFAARTPEHEAGDEATRYGFDGFYAAHCANNASEKPHKATMTAAIELTAADWLGIEREHCRRGLVNFVRQAWPVLEPSTEYQHNWHIDAICDHLQAVGRGGIRNLLITVPPRFAKSLLVSVFWPAWTWTDRPSVRWMFASYAESLSRRDSRKTRMLMQSPWYRSLWGDVFHLLDDQNQVLRFDNDRAGYRIATSVGGAATGEGGDVVVVDDAHNVKQARSQVERENALIWWDETMSTRLNDPKTGARVIVMQRLHERDLAGHVLEQGGYEHLCLPNEYEPDRRCTTSIGFTDPRTEAGELLWPERFGPEETAAHRSELGSVGYAGQFQQRPMPRGGGMFRVDRFRIVDRGPAPDEIAASVRFWDKAGTEGGGARTAGVLMHRLVDGSYVVSDVALGQWSALERERRIRQAAEMDGPEVVVWVEQEPGSGGKESAQSTIRNLAGYKVHAQRVTGDKESRAEPYAAQVEGGNVALVRADWNRAFLDEHETFPAGRYKDQVDAGAGAFNKLAARREPTLAAPAGDRQDNWARI